MIRKALITALAVALCMPGMAAKKKTGKKAQFPVAVTELKTERMTDPMSIDTPAPRLGWVITSDKQDVMQTSYRIIVASTKEKADNLTGDLWDATVESDQSQWIRYAGKELRSNTPCYWRVKVNTTQGESDWSETAMWNVGLLNESDWSGQWIGLDKAMPWDIEDVHSQLSSRYLRTEFKVEKEVERATLYISGLGMYEAYINGKKVGDQVLAPAPTDYRKTVLYNAFDVTSMLAADNAIGVVLGNGWYNEIDYVWVYEEGLKNVWSALAGLEGWAESSMSSENPDLENGPRDSYGFNAVPSGMCWQTGAFGQNKTDVSFWMPHMQSYGGAAITFTNNGYLPDFSKSGLSQYRGYSVRCVKD